MTSGALAKALYAPNATLMMESGIIDFEPTVPLNHIADCLSCRGFSFATDLFSAFTMTYRGFVRRLASSEWRRWTNTVTSIRTVKGDYDRPELRLPGSGGAADFISIRKKTV
jgi:glutaconate CoA-transferase subunit B